MRTPRRIRAALRRRLWWVKELPPLAQQSLFRVERRVRRIVPHAQRPNVILLSVDSMGAGHLGCYGYERPTSPELDRLAAAGVLFENVLTQSTWTKPALASMLTALYPSVHRADSVGEAGDSARQADAREVSVLTDRFRTLAQELAEAGYATVGFTNGGYAHSFFGFGRGFDLYDDQAGSFKSCSYRLLRWALRLPAGTPFFAFIHCWDVHFPYLDRPPFNRMFGRPRPGVVLNAKLRSAVNKGRRQLTADEVENLRAQYDGGIRYADGHIGRFAAELRSLGLLDRTILAITADHGEAFMEHGRIEHTRCIYNEVLRIPLIMHGPELRGPYRVRAQVRAIDIMPTLLDLCGLVPKDEVQGVNLEPWMHGRREDDLLAVTETIRAGGQRAISDGKFKLIHFHEGDRTELYDLAADPGERRDLAARRPDLRARLADRLQTWEEETEAVRARYWDGAGESGRAEMSPEVIRRLEELGYLG